MRPLTIQTILKWVYNRLVPTLLALLAVIGLWFVAQQSENHIYSLFMRWSAKPVVDKSLVTLILIDDKSITRLSSRFGPPPWPRKAYLEVFRRIAATQPTLMVFDSHFVSLNQKEDEAFFSALRQYPNLIGGLVMEEAGDVSNSLNTHRPQYYRLNLGVVSVQEDPDGVIRSLRPVYQIHTGLGNTGIFPALSMAAVLEYLNNAHPGQNWMLNLEQTDKTPNLKLFADGAGSSPQAITLPLTAAQSLNLRWYRILNAGKAEYARSHTAIPLWHFFDETKAPTLRQTLHGRIALIGSSSTFYRDYHQTPMANRHSGPDIHATAIDNILQGQALKKTDFWINLAILVFLCQIVFYLRLEVRGFGKTLLYTLGGMVIYCWVAFWFFAERSLWLDVITPEVFMVAAFLAGSTFRIIFKEKQLAIMEKNLSQLVDPEVFQEIRRLSHILKPGGQKLEITSMFVDIRNFTALAERLQPNEVTELLNEFYGDIVNIVFAYHGTIDKFMGDGILIIFGAPLPNENHRAMALLAANDILAATGKLSRHWQRNLGIDTDIGISVNSGVAFVGFLGPADKLEYTGVGDTVNICVRLQEHTKQFQTRLILSEHTVKALQTQPEESIPPDSLVELGEVTVRGREATIRIFTLRHAFLTPPP